MSNTATRSAVVASFACLAVIAAARAQSSPIPLGSEFQVNTYTSQTQGLTSPWAARAAGGGFVVVWDSYLQDGSDRGVFARRWSAAGIAQASEFRVNDFTVGRQEQARVASDDAGNFVVVWRDFARGIFGRRFNATGSPQAVEFAVNTYSQGGGVFPAIAADADGDFVVAWDAFDGLGDGVFARRFSSSGVPQAVAFQVNTRTLGGEHFPSISMRAGGDFIIAWEGTDDLDNGVFARRYDSSGGSLATDFQVNTYTPGQQSYPKVALGAAGDFVVVWDSQAGGVYAIFVQRFSAAGVKQASEFQVNAFTADLQYGGRVAMRGAAGFVVTWASQLQDGSNYGVFGRLFDSAGLPQAEEFQANSYTPGEQRGSSIVVDNSGDFVVAWVSFGEDGDDGGIFAQRYGTLAVLDIDGNGELAALSDGLLVLRYLFGFTGTTLTVGAIGNGCSRCDAPAIEAYLQTLI